MPEKSLDIIFENTVFQHIPESITKNYLLTSNEILKDNGIILCQFLMNDEKPIKKPFTKNKEGIVYYSHNEVLTLDNDCNLKIEKFGNFEWRDEKIAIGNYIYLQKLTKITFYIVLEIFCLTRFFQLFIHVFLSNPFFITSSLGLFIFGSQSQNTPVFVVSTGKSQNIASTAANPKLSTRLLDTKRSAQLYNSTSVG